MSSDFERFLIDLVNSALQKVEQGFIAEIVEFDKENMRATIKPFLKFVTEENGFSSPEDLNTANIENVPVEHLNAGGAYIRPNYTNGDKVHVQLCSSSIQQPIDSDIRSNMAINRFNLNSCVVTGGVVPENFSPPKSWEERDGLIIGNDDTLIEFLESEINIVGDVNIDGVVTIGTNVGQQTIIDKGEVTADSEVSAGSLGTGLTTHTHPYTDTPAGAAVTQSPTPGS